VGYSPALEAKARASRVSLATYHYISNVQMYKHAVYQQEQQ